MEAILKQPGKVWLLGAGPGDAGLLTCKAREILGRAEVVVYDALLSPEILAFMPDKAEKINAGKRAGNHAMPQEEMNRLLLEKAMEGKQVVRLKGGDPFVFGRGGEELELLAKQGIAFEVVPGVTSAVAVPAYAGIPVTHRDMTSSFHIITGHARHGGTDRIDYEALVKMKATLVFLMGISSLQNICEGLLKAGMEPDTPAAVISKGTTAAQKQVLGAVSTLAEKAKRAEIKTPAVIIVGEVCRLAEMYAWSEKRPLGGISVLVTRPAERSSGVAGKLRFLGAQVIEMPLIRTERLRDNQRLKEILKQLHVLAEPPRADMKKQEEAQEQSGKAKQEVWLVFTSPSGIKLFFEQLMEWRMDLRTIFSERTRIAVLGKGTAKELAEHGIFADLMPEEYSAAALGNLLVEKFLSEGSTTGESLSEKGQKRRIYIIRAKEGSKDLTEPLLRAGIPFEDIPLYETIYVKNEVLNGRVKEFIHDKELDFVAFTSASTVHGFASVLRLSREEIMDAGFQAVCIGKKTAAAAEIYGMNPLISKRAEMDSMIELLLSKAKKSEVS